MKVNYYGDVFELNQVDEGLWISEPTDHDECLVFESYKNGFATGHTPNFIEVAIPSTTSLTTQVCTVELTHTDGNLCYGKQ